jgi:L-cysteine:1D-myo-inositol 2-amino-2-deoxy-alpha-D-glucopyranoside ligase
MAALRVLPPDHLVGAVEALGEIAQLNAILADRGALYDVDGDTYFSRSVDAAFGSVSGYDAATMLALAAERGGDPGRPGKKDPLDPVVWLARRPGEPHWDSRFGRGRPGWHVECAAIAIRYLGVVFDVQAGGSDLIFPHHEFSASHARAAYGSSAIEPAGEAEGGPAADADEAVFARRYAHAGMVRLGGEKMSKSLGNLVFVSRLREAGVDPMAIRLAILAHHYRRDWDWTDDLLDAAQRRLGRWREAVAAGSASLAGEAVLTGIRERLADDLDAPGSLAIVDRWADAVLGERAVAGAAGRPQAKSARLVADAIDALLGVDLGVHVR